MQDNILIEFWSLHLRLLHESVKTHRSVSVCVDLLLDHLVKKNCYLVYRRVKLFG